MVAAARSKLKILKIVLYSILGVILAFVLVVVGTLLVKKYIVKEPVPTFAGYGYCVVVTSSMSGTIEKNDMVVIKKTGDYRLGDIVTFVESNGEVVTHRIVREGPEEGTFYTKGDHNKDSDPYPISVNQIIGEVVLTIPKVGIVFNWFLHGGGIIYILALVVVVIAGIFFLSMLKPSKEDNNAAVAEATADANAEAPATPQEESKTNQSDSPQNEN